MTGVSVVIAARNAALTIERAVRSARDQCDELILVDDWSTDETLSRARAAGGSHLRVVRPVTHVGLGDTRQVGLDSVRTEYGVWLDADDELLPGRVARIAAALDAGADLVADAVDVHDGPSGEFRCRSEVPPYVQAQPVRLFERNYLPAPGLIGFRVSTLRGAGYDRTLDACEDVDILLRALMDGAVLTALAIPGCRVFAFAESVSRDRVRQRAMYQRVLRKLDDAAIRRLYLARGCAPVVAWWALVSIAIFRGELDRADAWLDEIAASSSAGIILEPDGPCPRPEAWRMLFHRGTLRLLRGDAAAARCLLHGAEDACPTAEGANNLGVALAMEGCPARARAQFATALERHPQFADAQVNLTDPDARRITTHPLRRDAVRQDYR